MELIGYINSITTATANIDFGRKGFAIKGKAEEGRVSYEKGITEAMLIFHEALLSADPHAIFLLEYTFIFQELNLCDKSDTDTINSLTNAVQGFDDGFLALEVVKSEFYKEAEKTYPHHKDYRIKGYPKDAFHVACGSHRARLKNILKTPGLDPIEKNLLKQRFANLSTAQNAYIELQKKTMDKI